MSERSNVESEVRTRAARDAEYRARLVADPRATLAADHDIDVPTSLGIRVVEEGSDEVVLVIPAVLPSSDDLSDAELEHASGGWDWTNTCTCYDTCPGL